MGFGKMISGLFKKDADREGADIRGGDSIETAAGVEETQRPNTNAASAVEASQDNPPADKPNEELTENKILEVLSNVYDPEIPIDIVNLGLIYGIDIEGGNVRISMTMTAPGCPASTQIAGESKILVGEIPGVENVEIDIVWDPPWDPSKMSEEAQDSLGIF